jgi:hypothetical protein
VDADRDANICPNEGSITENVGPGKARVRHGDFPLMWITFGCADDSAEGASTPELEVGEGERSFR